MHFYAKKCRSLTCSDKKNLRSTDGSMDRYPAVGRGAMGSSLAVGSMIPIGVPSEARFLLGARKSTLFDSVIEEALFF
jgi:hypothetical protein